MCPHMLAVVAAAVVALRGDDGLERVEDVLFWHITQRVRQPRERGRRPVAGRHLRLC